MLIFMILFRFFVITTNHHLKCKDVLLTWIMVGQGLTVLAVGAGRSRLTISPLPIIRLFFLDLSGIDVLLHFQQNFSYIREIDG